MRRVSFLVAVSILALAAAPQAHAFQRAFVASYGSDANTSTNCLITGPCRSFAAAMTVVDTGGEIVALDGAGYAPVVIDRSVTITSNPGFYAGIAAATGIAVHINNASAKVTLRGLNINGIGATDGIWLQSGASLTVENCTVSNFNYGVGISAPADVRIVDSVIRDNSFYGVAITKAATVALASVRILGNTQVGLMVGTDTGTSLVSLTDSVVAGNAVGVKAESLGGTPRIAITRSTISNQAIGVSSIAASGFASVVVTNTTVTGSTTSAFYQSGAAALHSLGNNMLTHNIADTTGTISSMAPQ